MPRRVVSLASRVPTLSRDVARHSWVLHSQQEKSGGSFSEMEECVRLDLAWGGCQPASSTTRASQVFE